MDTSATEARRTHSRSRDHRGSRSAEASKIPEIMRAAAIDRFGGPEVLSIRSLPVPSLDAGELLIAVDTAGVGVWDAQTRDGSFASSRKRFPLVLGTERWSARRPRVRSPRSRRRGGKT
jgi:hypothetical protein